MNIFKMLSDGDGRIHEPSMSAFLGYLLDVAADHGMGSILLELFLKSIVFENENIFNVLKDNKEVSSLSVYSNFIVEVTLEFKLEGVLGDRHIDILIEIWKINQDGEKEAAPLYIFGIENKIREANETNVKEQLRDEISFLKDYSNNTYNTQPKPSIGFIFLTPSKSTVNISDDEVKIKNLIWNKPKNDEKREESIYCMLSEILKKETHGECEPIFEYTRHTIKALMKFIESGFKLYSKEIADRSGRVVDPLELFEKGKINENDVFYFRDKDNHVHQNIKCKVLRKRGTSSSFKINIESFNNHNIIDRPSWQKVNENRYTLNFTKDNFPFEDTPIMCSVALHRLLKLCDDNDLSRNDVRSYLGENNFVRKTDGKSLAELRNECRGR